MYGKMCGEMCKCADVQIWVANLHFDPKNPEPKPKIRKRLISQYQKKRQINKLGYFHRNLIFVKIFFSQNSKTNKTCRGWQQHKPIKFNENSSFFFN